MHQILNQDCLEGLSQLESGTFDLALIDAPYFDYKTHHRKDKEDKLSQSLVQQSRKEQLLVVSECLRVLKEGAAFWYFTNWQEAWWFQSRYYTFLHNQIIWDKGNWTAGDLVGSLGSKYEVIFLGVKGKGWKYRGERLHDIWTDIPRVGTNRIHPTEKPVALYRKIIELSTDEGAWIIDPYGGSGSSAQAAVELNRNILMYEIDREFHSRILRRLDAL